MTVGAAGGGRTVGIVALVALLTLTVATANAAVAADRTVLDSTFVKTALEEEGTYEAMQAAVVDQVAADVAETAAERETALALPIEPEPLVTEAVSTAYLQDQVEANVDRFYAYLHGERSDPGLVVNLTPVQESVAESVGEEIRAMSVRELLSLASGDDRTSFEVQDTTVNLTIVAELAESRESYRETRDEFRAELRERLLTRVVDRTMANASNDQLLALVIEDYDPTQHTEREKASMVDRREDEIRAAVRDRVADRDAVNETVDRQLTRLHDEVSAQVESEARAGSGDLPPSVMEPAVDIALIGVDGLTTDMRYETYRTRLEDARGRLAANVSAIAAARLEESMPDRLDLTEEMDSGTRAQLRTARTVVGVADAAVYLLPFLGLVLIGGLWFVGPSPVVAAIGTGIALLLGGIPGYVAATVLPGQVRSAVGSGIPGAIGDAIVGVVERVAGVVAAQSIGLVAAGAVVIAGATAYYAYRSRASEA